MKATSFWDRVWAYLLDALILFPLGILSIFATVVSVKLGVSLHALLTPVSFIYAFYFISLRGQTIGKRVLGIKVVRLDGGDVGRREAVLRGLVDLFFATALGISSFVASMTALSLQADQSEVTFVQAVQILNAGQGEGMGQILSVLSIVYAVAQLIYFFASPERRFIHDFVAGTRVVKLQSSSNNVANAAN